MAKSRLSVSAWVHLPSRRQNARQIQNAERIALRAIHTATATRTAPIPQILRLARERALEANALTAYPRAEAQVARAAAPTL